MCIEGWHVLLQGGVSVMAHSLGSVLSYDVLCNQPHLYAGLHLPQPQAHSPEAVQQTKRARIDPADTQVPILPPSLTCTTSTSSKRFTFTHTSTSSLSKFGHRGFLFSLFCHAQQASLGLHLCSTNRR